MKVAIYGKDGCGICVQAKNKMKHFNLKKVDSLDEWQDGTWVERDAVGLKKGTTDEFWRRFPDIDVLAFISMEETDKIPLIWIDGDVYYYSEAMKELKRLKKLKEDVVVSAPKDGPEMAEVGAA